MTTPNAKELKEALAVLGPLTRDRLNAAIGLKNEIAHLERVRDALAIAQRVATEDSARNEKTVSDHERLTKEIADLERTKKTLTADTATTKEAWQAAQQDLATARAELTQLQEQAEAARAIIQCGEKTQRILASLPTH